MLDEEGVEVGPRAQVVPHLVARHRRRRAQVRSHLVLVTTRAAQTERPEDLDQVPHRDTFDEANLLTRGQEIAVEVDRSKAVNVVLQPGEMSLHHVRLFHGSDENRSGGRRIGYAIRYIPTRLRQLGGVRTTATLVRGEDRYGHFDPEPIPTSEFAPEAVAFHAATIDRTNDVLYAGAAKKRTA